MINSVRNTVLSVLNKNNYGYISPSDFNLYAKQAQMEIFEEYFSSFNKATNMENARMSGSDYADIAKTLSEAIELFLVSNYLTPYTPVPSTPTNEYYLPSVITTGDEAYLINKVLCYTTQLTSGTNTSAVASTLTDAGATFITDGVSIGDVVVNLTTGLTANVLAVSSQTTLVISSNIFLAAPVQYQIYSASSVKEAEKVSSGKITMLTNSMLTSPTNLFPAYTNIADKIRVYPSTITGLGQVQAVYFRYPKEPKWTYISLANGEPVFDQTQPDYQDFELPTEDEFKLVTKILEYCGMSIRESEVTQFGMAQQQHEEPTFSQQQ
jgi:hypothetical protein